MATSILLSPPYPPNTSYPSSSASSMSSLLNTPAHSAASLSSRRTSIRFAPLPCVGDDLQIVDIDDTIDSKRDSYGDSSSTSSDSRPPSPVYNCLPAPTPTPPQKPTTQQMLVHHSITPGLHWSKPRSLSLLPFPFKKLSPSSSNNSLTPTPSLDSNPTPTISRAVSSDSIPSTGLFRPLSKDSTATRSPSSWRFGFPKLTSSTASSPLTRTQSVPTRPPPPSTPKVSQSSSQPPKPRSQTISAAKLNPRKGLRMLNGRVYGGPKHRPPSGNPFANARDEDLEFVEWGYGGMGSVRGARSAGVGSSTEGTNWSRLQHNGRNVVVGSISERGDGEEEDDGSGMAWVKKRKAEKERKEKERAEAEAARNSLPPVLESEDNDTTSLAPLYTHHPSSSSVATATPSPPFEEASEHVYTAVTVPVHLPRRLRRAQSRSTSVDTIPSIATVVPIPEEGPASIESDSESESEEGVQQAEDDYGDDEEEDDEKEEGRSKMVLGAGVEKISRHNQSA